MPLAARRAIYGTRKTQCARTPAAPFFPEPRPATAALQAPSGSDSGRELAAQHRKETNTQTHRDPREGERPRIQTKHKDCIHELTTAHIHNDLTPRTQDRYYNLTGCYAR